MKKLFLTLSVFAVSYMANAAYLYWQLDDTGVDETYTGVQISAKNGEASAGTVQIYGSVWSDEAGDYVIGAIDSSQVQAGTTYLIDESSINSGYSYYIELVNSDTGKTVNDGATAISGSDFASWASSATVSSDLTDLAGGEIAVWHASTGGMSVIPEPTSGLMLLLGAAMLGLKRKNRSIA